MWWNKKHTDEVLSSVKSVKNWYTEQYEKAIVQRNILFVLILIFFILVVVSIIAISNISTSKTFEPFVIQIDETTGSAVIVNPVQNDVLLSNESLSQYFIKKYITARETYNKVDFENYARQVIRLLSSQNIYSQYLSYIRIPDNDPLQKYAEKNSTIIKIKSWSKLDSTTSTKYLVRFSLLETGGNKLVFNKIAVVEYKYVPMDLKEDERDINPIGFQITGYRVDDDES